jgi:hypothetical protein
MAYLTKEKNMFKNRYALTFTVLATLSAPSVFAAFSIDELVEATKVALKDFQTKNPEHVTHFSGYKSWKSGEDAKVKVYVNHEGMNMEYDFVCQKHTSGIECHLQ